MDRVVVYPGSFDPMTNGHTDIVERSKALFTRVHIGILRNPEKRPLFTIEERLEMIREIYAGDPAVESEAFDGLLVDFAERVGARAIIRGLRAPTELEYELQMALMNRRLRGNIETLFMVPNEEFTFVSSSLVKEVFSLGGSIEGLVPAIVEERLAAKVG
ncbi:MAG TPA: pantetheine-phosphate adenylyltransferase [Acidobacteriota bacterium]|jgi:pantetheine-phosphate adenylyltransferase